MKTTYIFLTLAVLATLSIMFLFFTASQQTSTTGQTTYTQTPTTPTRTILTTPTQTTQPKEVVVSNPLGSGSNTSMTFNPRYIRLVIGVNNTVTWVNEDNVIHTVTSTTRLFDYTLQPGQRISYTFTSPGTFTYVCTLHPWMVGEVEVVGR